MKSPDKLGKYEAIVIKKTPWYGYSVDGIIWLKKSTKNDRLCLLPCLLPGGFERQLSS
jgi:hypothetical protein